MLSSRCVTGKLGKLVDVLELGNKIVEKMKGGIAAATQLPALCLTPFTPCNSIFPEAVRLFSTLLSPNTHHYTVITILVHSCCYEGLFTTYLPPSSFLNCMILKSLQFKENDLHWFLPSSTILFSCLVSVHL